MLQCSVLARRCAYPALRALCSTAPHVLPFAIFFVLCSLGAAPASSEQREVAQRPRSVAYTSQTANGTLVVLTGVVTTNDALLPKGGRPGDVWPFKAVDDDDDISYSFVCTNGMSARFAVRGKIIDWTLGTSIMRRGPTHAQLIFRGSTWDSVARCARNNDCLHCPELIVFDRPELIEAPAEPPRSPPLAAAPVARPAPVVKPTLAEIRASKTPHRVVATFRMGETSIGQTVRILDTAIEVTLPDSRHCTMWFGNIGAAGRHEAGFAGYHPYPNVDAIWNVGRDTLFPQLASRPANALWHCSVVSEQTPWGADDIFYFSSPAARDRFFADLYRSMAAWHKRFPNACAVDRIIVDATPLNGPGGHTLGSSLCNARFDPLLTKG